MFLLMGKKLMLIIKHELEKIVSWLSVNKLSLNIKKTPYIVFNLKNVIKISNICNDVQINGIYVSKVEVTKFLGVYIDSKISWSSHLK